MKRFTAFEPQFYIVINILCKSASRLLLMCDEAFVNVMDYFVPLYHLVEEFCKHNKRKLAHPINNFVLAVKMKISLETVDVFNCFNQNFDCWYTLEPPRLTNTHSLCFR